MSAYLKGLALGAMLVVSSAAAAQALVCPVDNLQMMWTGKTRFENAVMLKEYRCLRGHTRWGR